jgi:hypothetical protein
MQRNTVPALWLSLLQALLLLHCLLLLLTCRS